MRVYVVWLDWYNVERAFQGIFATQAAALKWCGQHANVLRFNMRYDIVGEDVQE